MFYVIVLIALVSAFFAGIRVQSIRTKKAIKDYKANNEMLQRTLRRYQEDYMLVREGKGE